MRGLRLVSRGLIPFWEFGRPGPSSTDLALADMGDECYGRSLQHPVVAKVGGTRAQSSLPVTGRTGTYKLSWLSTHPKGDVSSLKIGTSPCRLH